MIRFPKNNDAIKLPIGFALIINPKVNKFTPFSNANGGKNGVIKDRPIIVNELHDVSKTNITY